MSDQAVILPKWFSHEGIILAKGPFDHSCTFWTTAYYHIKPSRKFWWSVSTFMVVFLLFSHACISLEIPVFFLISNLINTKAKYVIALPIISFWWCLRPKISNSKLFERFVCEQKVQNLNYWKYKIMWITKSAYFII